MALRYSFGAANTFHGPLNRWDIFASILIFTVLFALAWAAKDMSSPYQLGDAIHITLAPTALPFYAIRSVLRMAIALLCSIIFTFAVGTWAAKNRRVAKVVVPLVDVLQAVPVLSFLSITIVVFIRLFPKSLLGPECASIFAIFTAQAWNMMLGFYQTVRNVPPDLIEVSNMLHLSAWQRFWRLEVPSSMSSLLWNMMMSMSASWFFVVASEAISVSGQNILLPGIGSYIKVAIDHADVKAVLYAIIAMFLVILIYDQLIFRPLIKWSEKFIMTEISDERLSQSWFLNLLQRTRFLSKVGTQFGRLFDRIINIQFKKHQTYNHSHTHNKSFFILKVISNYSWIIAFAFVVIFTGYLLVNFIIMEVPYTEIYRVFLMGLATATRVIILILLASLLWTPLGVWIGRRPHLTQTLQPIVQFLASFPANLLFPVVVMAIVKFNLNVEIWVTPLMILGSQWYILFNVIAGTTAIPKDLYQVADNLNVKGWQWWSRLALPGIFPYYITGAMTAAGGAWNASIVAEYVSWGNTKLQATGLGAYIAQYTALGDFHRIALGTSMMCLFVLLFNRILWQPLYDYAAERFKLT